MPNRVVVFDLDKTLARCNVSFAFGRFLYQRKHISFFCMVALVFFYGCNKLQLISLKKLHTVSFRLFFYKKSQALVEAEVQVFLQEHTQDFFRYSMLEELSKAKSRGDWLWIQSSSPIFLVKPISDYLQVAHAIGTRYGIDNKGAFCSIEHIIDGEAKLAILSQFLQEKGLALQDVTVYSDSIVDLPLLECVGAPVAVDPDRQLRKIAQDRKWKIVAA